MITALETLEGLEGEMIDLHTTIKQAAKLSIGITDILEDYDCLIRQLQKALDRLRKEEKEQERMYWEDEEFHSALSNALQDLFSCLDEKQIALLLVSPNEHTRVYVQTGEVNSILEYCKQKLKESKV